MSAIVVSEDIDSQLSDEFADQSNVTDSEGEFSDELDMAGFFVAFKKVHHKRGAISHHPMRFLSTGLSESENDFDADRWKCLECNQVNNRSFFRYCEKCWKVRRMTRGARPGYQFRLMPTIIKTWKLGFSYECI